MTQAKYSVESLPDSSNKLCHVAVEEDLNKKKVFKSMGLFRAAVVKLNWIFFVLD